MGFTQLTKVQKMTIPYTVQGNDAIVSAKTGSGKTLAFLIPVIEKIVKAGYRQINGTAAIIITPTRELAVQIYGVVRELTEHHSMTHGVIMGKANRKVEVQRLEKGVTIVVATPGRLLDHLSNTTSWIRHNICALVIDEADRILELGHQFALGAIISKLNEERSALRAKMKKNALKWKKNKKERLKVVSRNEKVQKKREDAEDRNFLESDRQTLLFSATNSPDVLGLVKEAFDKEPKYFELVEKSDSATRSTLEQGYIFVKSEQRFALLYTFLKKFLQKKKIIVFFSTCASVTYHEKLFNFIDVPCLALHGKLKQKKRITTFFEFRNSKKSIMLCTDVLARGLDIPAVDWVIQYDPPENPKDYIHRVGRTIRGIGGKGKALLFLLPQEIGYVKYLEESKIPIEEYQMPKVRKVQRELEELVGKNYYFNSLARKAYRSYMISYAQQQMKDVFNVQKLDPVSVATAFGFHDPPHIKECARPITVGIRRKRKNFAKRPSKKKPSH